VRTSNAPTDAVLSVAIAAQRLAESSVRETQVVLSGIALGEPVSSQTAACRAAELDGLITTLTAQRQRLEELRLQMMPAASERPQ